MIIIHNILIRSINAIYLQCVNISSPKDVSDFMEYCAEWGHVIHEHHLTEETDVFPGIEQLAGEQGLMERNVEQHHDFFPGLEKFNEYVREVKDSKVQYDGQKFREIIDSFMPSMYRHLVEEIPTLLVLNNYEDKVDWDKYWRKKSAEIMDKGKADPNATKVFLPFCLSGHDATFEDGVFNWPPMPWLAKMLFRYWFHPIHNDWWRFAPCDASSNPQVLPFA
ncbi:hemerythrin HHE cation binding domain-containing protein [Hypoxylon crocopeplum]|nr:hemerythrin HHE cation binding domain-containing protein [Hypoxylon crocopeplum]